jgi:hypothetical protein
MYKRLTRGVFRFPSAHSDAKSVLIDACELALILEGIELPTRKQKMKSAAKEGRSKALHAIASTTTQHGA